MTERDDDVPELDRAIAEGRQLFYEWDDDDGHYRIPLHLVPLVVGDDVQMTVADAGWIERGDDDLEEE